MNIFCILFVVIVQIKLIFACGIGCQNCDLTNMCKLCYDNFFLDVGQGICIYQNCGQNLYYQKKSAPTQGMCQAVCDENYIKNETSSTCELLDKCSETYSLQTGVNANEEIKQLIPFEGDKFLIVYQRQINVMEISTGRFLQAITLDSKIVLLQYFENSFYMFFDDDQIERVQIANNQTDIYNSIVDGQIDQNTSIVNVNDSYGLLITYDTQSKQQFIRLLIDLKTQSFVSNNSVLKIEQVQNNQVLKICNDLIFASLPSSAGGGISIKQIYLNDKNELELKDYSSIGLCAALNIGDIDSIVKYNQNEFILTFVLLQSYVVLSQSSCSQFVLSDYPIKLYSILFNSNQFYIFHLTYSLLILDDSLHTISSITENDSRLLDSIAINVSDTYFLLSTLNEISTQIFYTFDPVKQTVSQFLQQSINIVLPAQLILISLTYVDSSTNLIQIIAYYKSIQSTSLNIVNNNTVLVKDQYLLQYFTRKIIDMQNLIASFSINQESNLISACSVDGQVMTWDCNKILEPRIVDQNIIDDQGQCHHLQYISYNNVLILFDQAIIAFDTLHQSALKSWAFVNLQSKQINRFILTQNDYSVLIFDSCLVVINSLFEELLTDCSIVFDDIIIKAILDPSFYLVIQKAQSFHVFYIDVVSSVMALKVINSYTSPSVISQWKIRNFPVTYQVEQSILFEIVSFFVDQSFAIYSEQLSLIYIQQMIPLSSSIDISFVDTDPYDLAYFILGISSQKAALYRFQIYTIMKGQNINYYAAFTSSGNMLFPIYKYIDPTSGQAAYDIKVALVLGYLTLIQSFGWSLAKQDDIVMEVNLGQGIFMNNFALMNMNEFYVFGDIQGIMSVNLRRKQYYSKVCEINPVELSQQDYIQTVKQSLVLQKYFVVKSYILVYNLYTNELEEQINIEQSSLTPIQQFNIIESLQLIICSKDNVIFIKNYLTNEVYEYNKMASLKNIILQDKSLIAYGSEILILDYQLNIQQSQVNNLDNSTVQECLVIPSSLVCKMISATIYIYDLLTLQPLKQFQSRFLTSSFLLQVDIQYQRIFLFTSNIEVYSFSGSFTEYISSVNIPIVELDIYDFDIALKLSSCNPINYSQSYQFISFFKKLFIFDEVEVKTFKIIFSDQINSEIKIFQESKVYLTLIFPFNSLNIIVVIVK